MNLQRISGAGTTQRASLSHAQETGDPLGRYEKKRSDIRDVAEAPPFNFPPGLAHVVATVSEPRCDDQSPDPELNEIIKDHRRRLWEDLNEILPKKDSGADISRLGGEVEDVVERAARRLRDEVGGHGAHAIVERLDRLADERRLGAPTTAASPVGEFQVELDDLPRSSSGRRVGVWR